jgi:hypothetical protein
MRLPFVKQVQVFLEESVSYLFAYAIYAILVGSIVAFIEYEQQQSDLGVRDLLLLNGSHWVLANVVFAVSMFLAGWGPKLLGSEFVSSVITAVIALGLLYAAKSFVVHYYELEMASPQMTCALSSLALLVPYIVFSVFLFVIRSADFSK